MFDESGVPVTGGDHLAEHLAGLVAVAQRPDAHLVERA